MNSVDKAKYNQAMASVEIIYISTTSLFCILPMLADLLYGLCNKKFRFPCKYFSFYTALITASSSVFLRLPMTLDHPMPYNQVAKLRSMARMAFMSTMVANMLPSLGSMKSDTLHPNVIGFLILTIMAIMDSFMELINTGVIGHVNLPSIQVAMLVALQIILISAAITISSIKKILKSKYHSISERFSNDQHPQDRAALKKLKQDVERYEMMLEMGNPEYIMASGMISLTVLVAYILVAMEVLRMSGSGFRWCSLSTTQSIGVVVGSIAPICRCFMAASLEASDWWNGKHLAVFELEEYWTQQLYEWKYSHTIPSLYEVADQEN
ncbi:hypothetical protein L1887_29994 [Cichorium endivia]|nr:hypothetical protein L1887_29994 [Cichorium endivia]